MLNVNEQVKMLISTVTIYLESENDELVERPVTPDKSNNQKKSRQVEKQILNLKKCFFLENGNTNMLVEWALKQKLDETI